MEDNLRLVFGIGAIYFMWVKAKNSLDWTEQSTQTLMHQSILLITIINILIKHPSQLHDIYKRLIQLIYLFIY